MDFREYVESHREEIHSTIMKYLPLKEPKDYTRIIREYSERQGKYFRPGLLMLSGEMLGAKPKDLLLPAAAMQLSEDWILMHDDVEDDSEMRRGKPALHKLYGVEHAINAGDAAHIAMWKMLSDYVRMRGATNGIRVLDKFYELLYRTTEGQYLDIKFARDVRQIGNASEKMYYDIISKKTSCYSVYGPMQIGATVAGCNSRVMKALKEIGGHAGTAFQIIDDVLDVTATEKAFGKRKYGDLYEGKLTIVMLETYKLASRAERIKIDRIYKKDRREKTRGDIDFLAFLIEKHKSAVYAYELAMKEGEKARKALKENMHLLPDNEYRDLFISAVTALFVRKK